MVEIGPYLDIIRLIVGVLILGIASYTDIKTRRASNWLWVVMGAIGGILLLVQYVFVVFDNVFFLVFIPIIIVLMCVFFQLGLIFGGADAKALMAIAVLVPFKPVFFGFPFWEYSFMPGSWIVFTAVRCGQWSRLGDRQISLFGWVFGQPFGHLQCQRIVR